MAAGENRFAPELNEKEVIELVENAIPGSIKKAAKYGVRENISRLKLENFILIILASELVKAKQCKLRQFTHLLIICTL